MNNLEISKIIELKKEKGICENEIREIYHFLSAYEKSFKYFESIKALKKIRTYANEKDDKSKEIDEKIKNIAKVMEINCSHKIIISGTFKYDCPICYMSFKSMKELPESTKYLINDYNWEEESDKTDELVLDSENEDEAIRKILDYYGNLQYSEDIEIKEVNNEKRRIKKNTGI